MVLNDELSVSCLEQVKKICELLYPANTNIDYFQTNFVLQDDVLYYIGYECSLTYSRNSSVFDQYLIPSFQNSI